MKSSEVFALGSFPTVITIFLLSEILQNPMWNCLKTASLQVSVVTIRVCNTKSGPVVVMPRSAIENCDHENDARIRSVTSLSLSVLNEFARENIYE